MNDNKLKEEMNGLVQISANEYKRLILIEQHDKDISEKHKEIVAQNSIYVNDHNREIDGLKKEIAKIIDNCIDTSDYYGDKVYEYKITATKIAKYLTLNYLLKGHVVYDKNIIKKDFVEEDEESNE